MKRKIFSILFTLMLVASFSLIPAMPAMADGASPGVMLGTTGAGETEWTQETKQCGDYSAKLVWPAGDRAFATIIGIPDGLTVADVDSWDYWAKAPDDFCPMVTFYLDDPDIDNYEGKNYDTTVSIRDYDAPADTWLQVFSTTSYNYVTWRSDKPFPIQKTLNWSEFAAGFTGMSVLCEYGNATFTTVRIGKGTIGTTQDITVYADDFTMTVGETTTTYAFEAYQPETQAEVEVAGDTATLDATAAELSVNLSGAGEAANGTIAAFAFNGAPSTEIDKALVETESKSALKYVDVKATGFTQGDVTMTLSYTDEEVTAGGIIEDTLRLYYWYSDVWALAYNSSVNTTDNIIAGTIPASRLTGTPIAGAGTAEATGQYQVGAPPTVTVTFTSTEMNPQFEQTVTVGVSVPTGESRTLEELTQVLFKVWYDSNGGAPSQDDFNSAAASHAGCGIITWTPADGGTFTEDFAGSTTWLLGVCTAPALSGTSGDFILKFTPGKVATEATGTPIWQLAATATSEYGTSDLGYDADATAMNWYGEMVLAAVNIDWGSVPAGMDFENAMADQSLGTPITIISNGAYNLKTKSSATWTGTGDNTATLDSDGACATAEHFALKAAPDGTLPTEATGLLDTSGVAIVTVPYASDIFVESGIAYANATLWLKLANTFAQDVYSGTITYTVATAVY